jgi:hypothetical protein
MPITEKKTNDQASFRPGGTGSVAEMTPKIWYDGIFKTAR